MKKALSLFLALILSFSLTTPAFAVKAGGLEFDSFVDVSRSHWAYDAIMALEELELVTGYFGCDADGPYAYFSPNTAMNRNHFVVIMARYLYGKELAAMSAGTNWYSNEYNLLLKHGILQKSDFENGKLNVPMTRQEMAYVLTKVADVQNKAPASLVASSKIPDYNSINSYYRDGVVKAYSMGLITGTDSKGTFNPNGTLTRAQASTVIYRLINFKNGQGVVDPGVKHQHDLSWVGQRNGTHIKVCFSKEGTCDFNHKIIENCAYNHGGIEAWDFCKYCGDIPAVYYEKLSPIPNNWNGVGVNLNKRWNSENPLDGMPNTKAVAEKYGVEAGGYSYALTMNFVSLNSSIVTNGLTLQGFSYSCNDQDRYETVIAMLRDVLDEKSAVALIGWIEELDELCTAAMDALMMYGEDSAEYKAAEAAHKAHGNLLWGTDAPVGFGNVNVKWRTSGNTISIYIYNK